MPPTVSGPSSENLEILINGESWVVPGSATIATVITLVGVSPRGIAVALEGEVIPRSNWSCVRVQRGQRIELVSAAAGG